MKITKPAFLKNITRRMVVIWAVCFGAFLVIGFSTASIVLASIPKTFGEPITLSNILYIEYRNAYHAKQLFNQSEENHLKPMNEILARLSRSGRTNQLGNLFRGSPDQAVESNNTDTVYTKSFETTYATNALIIEYLVPEYGVRSISRSTFELVTAELATTQVYRIMIPLDKTANRFQAQTWYLLTSDPYKNSSDASMAISNKISTYGNYHKLWEYINELFVLL